MPLYENEFVLLANNSSTPTPNPTAASNAIYKLHIYNKDDIENYATVTPKRSFNISQFSGMPTYESSARLAIVPTEKNDYLLWHKSSTELSIYVVPRVATIDTIQPIQTITTDVGKGGSSYLLFGNTYVYMPSTSETKNIAFVRIDYNTNTSLPEIKYRKVVLNAAAPALGGGSLELYYPCLFYVETTSEVVNPYISKMQYDEVSVTRAINTTWHNHTILNLSTPISLAEDDVLTVSYSISVA